MSDFYIVPLFLMIFVLELFSLHVRLPFIGRSRFTIDLKKASTITILLLCVTLCIGTTQVRPDDILVLFMTLDGGITRKLFVCFYFLPSAIITPLFSGTPFPCIPASAENGATTTPDRRKSKRRKREKKKRPVVERDSEGGETIVSSTPLLKVNYKRLLGYGSHNTTVYEGSFQGRPVAVKCLPHDSVTLAINEVSILKRYDNHPNVVRYYYYQDSPVPPNCIHIALELCPASLADIIENLHGSRGGRGSEREEEWKAIAQEFDPMRAMKQIASGLNHLHGLGLVHRDIKPQNILIFSSCSSSGSKYRMLISDFGLCKKLDADQFNFVTIVDGATAVGTAGWRAPEMLCGNIKLDELSANDDTICSPATTIHGTSPVSSGKITPTPTTRLTKSIDIFALGCLFYYILTKGEHPYGDRFHREANIIKDDKDLSFCSNEAHDLIARMLDTQPSQRPDIETCRIHPFFWDPTKRLGFLLDVSDRFENMCKDPMDWALIRLERDAKDVVGSDWHQNLSQMFIENLRKTRKYDGSSVRDLMRALRNKKHHYQDLPDDVKLQLGSIPEGFLTYFTSRFPRLLIYAHEVVRDTGLYREPMFRTYFEQSEP